VTGNDSGRNAVPIIFGEGGDGDTHGKTFGDWLVQVAILGSPKASPQAKSAAIDRIEKVYSSGFNTWQKAAMADSSGTTGGYTVPPDFYQSLLAIAAEDNTFRQYGFVQPMASATLQFPYLDITTVQAAGTSPFFGGVIANWTAEAQNRTETEPAFKMMELKAQELSGYSVSSNILLQDAAFGLEKFLFTLFGKKFLTTEAQRRRGQNTEKTRGTKRNRAKDKTRFPNSIVFSVCFPLCLCG
jgi:HK97 family phage major capsid protein